MQAERGGRLDVAAEGGGLSSADAARGRRGRVATVVTVIRLLMKDLRDGSHSFEGVGAAVKDVDERIRSFRHINFELTGPKAMDGSTNNAKAATRRALFIILFRVSLW